jgi:hypothetical protein
MASDEPDFIGPGMFKWNADGYRFATVPPPSLSEPSTLHSHDAWTVLAAVLIRAKAGDFRSVPNLISCIKQSTNPVLARSCAHLLGDAGSAACLRKGIDELLDVSKINLCHSLRGSGYLWTVPVMLEAYFSVPSRSDVTIIPILISELLEPLRGGVAHELLSDDEYRELVTRKYEELRSQLGTDQVPVLFGEVFSVGKLAATLAEYLKSDDMHPIMVRDLRHWFEASTGIDCSGFFKDLRLQVLTATAIVEEFSESDDLRKYADGVRYFFGHRIPS